MCFFSLCNECPITPWSLLCGLWTFLCLKSLIVIIYWPLHDSHSSAS
uniref:Uncharacterized protein n=1 Tax=Rhizophora mucronata TaxID=61149 RepID=A0A2P2N6K1_RHIMU